MQKYAKYPKINNNSQKTCKTMKISIYFHKLFKFVTFELYEVLIECLDK